MNPVKTAALLSMTLLLVGGIFSSSAGAGVSFDFFYSDLAPHGSWMVSAQYGRVWQPREYAPDWNPYYDGHWVYTDLGWTWVSDYEWGAVPYHYGTWVADPAFGWVWVPGYTWAPAWVVFRTGPDFIGWAPVAPGFSLGISGGFVEPAVHSYVFVSCDHFLAPHVRSYVAPPSRTSVIVNHTRVMNNLVVERNVVVNRGPDVSIIERASGRRLRPMPIERVARVAPGSQVTRAQLRIDPSRDRHGIRAAEPVSRDVSPRSPGPSRREAVERAPANASHGQPSGKDSRQPRREGYAPKSTAGTAFDSGHPREPYRETRLHGEPPTRPRPDLAAQARPRGERLSRSHAPTPESASRRGPTREKARPAPAPRPPRKKDKGGSSSGKGQGHR